MSDAAWSGLAHRSFTPWCLGGNGGMGYRDHYEGLYRDCYRDPFPHSLLSTREFSMFLHSWFGQVFRDPST